MSAIWHDLECGGYTADLPVWEGLASRFGGPVLDVGAGTGRTALALARTGLAVTALDHDHQLLAELRARAGGLELETVQADAREFALGRRFALAIVPMQTIQLLGGAGGRARFLACAARHLRPGGGLAIALADELEMFEAPDGGRGPLPDVCELDGVVYSSRATAVRPVAGGFVLERLRETVTADGRLSSEEDLIRLDSLDAERLEDEGRAAGLRPAGQLAIAPTDEHVGTVVVVLSG